MSQRLASRIAYRITADGHGPYLQAIEDGFVTEGDVAQLRKIPPKRTENATRQRLGGDMKMVTGYPDPQHVSTSYVERQNGTVRTTMRCYTRLSKGSSRKLRTHLAPTALNDFAYTFIKVHRTLRTSPAMTAGVTDRLRDVADLVALWESYARKAERAA